MSRVEHIKLGTIEQREGYAFARDGERVYTVKFTCVCGTVVADPAVVERDGVPILALCPACNAYKPIREISHGKRDAIDEEYERWKRDMLRRKTNDPIDGEELVRLYPHLFE